MSAVSLFCFWRFSFLGSPSRGKSLLASSRGAGCDPNNCQEEVNGRSESFDGRGVSPFRAHFSSSGPGPKHSKAKQNRSWPRKWLIFISHPGSPRPRPAPFPYRRFLAQAPEGAAGAWNAVEKVGGGGELDNVRS